MSEIVIRIPLHALHALLTAAIEAPERDNERSNGNGHSNGHDHHGNDSTYSDPPADDRPWTDAQKRMVYRLVHQLGYEGDAARNFIATTLRLQPGETPGRRAASRLIDSLKDQLGPSGARREPA
ncbi:MAG: hypothetical protein M5U28_13930 [Sandaracinaceae bacterium]|nr:hypothetical protein [Sandaracinaceae bacterium]